MTGIDAMTAPREPEPDIADWLGAASSPLTAVGVLAASDAQARLKQAGRAIVYMRDANRRLIADVAELRRQLAALQPDGEGR